MKLIRDVHGGSKWVSTSTGDNNEVEMPSKCHKAEISQTVELELIMKTNSHVIKDGVWSIKAMGSIGPRSGPRDLQFINMDEARSLPEVLIQCHLHT